MKILLLTLPLLFFLTQLPGQSNPIDSSFNEKGYVQYRKENQNTRFLNLNTLPNNQTLACGYFFETSNQTNPVVARFNDDGSIDSTFGNNGNAIIYKPSLGCATFLEADGKIRVLGIGLLASGIPGIGSYLLNSDGTLDMTYGDPFDGFLDADIGLSIGTSFDSYRQEDGKFIVYGPYTAGLNPYCYVTRLNENGTVDLNFGDNGSVQPPEIPGMGPPNILAAITLPDGKILLGGGIGLTSASRQWYLHRLNPDGSNDPSFGTNGVKLLNFGQQHGEEIHDFLLLNNGQILASGHAEKEDSWHFTMVRMDQDGKTDPAFGLGGIAQMKANCCFSTINDVVQLADGRFVVCGFSTMGNFNKKIFSVGVFSESGIADQSFGQNGQYDLSLPFLPGNYGHVAEALELRQDGKVIIAGSEMLNNNAFRGVLVRILPSEIVNTKNQDMSPNPELLLYPNPLRHETITLSTNAPEPMNASVELWDSQGRFIRQLSNNLSIHSGPSEQQLQLPKDLSPGMYLIRLRSGTNSISRLLIKN